MSPSRARYVTACQQLLALGVVVIALVPATRVVSLDVVGVRPGTGSRAADDLGVPEPGGRDVGVRARQGALCRQAEPAGGHAGGGAERDGPAVPREGSAVEAADAGGGR